MSRATKRKHVLKEILDDDYSAPKPNQTIVKILKNRGNNLHEVIAPDQSTFLASMPTKFRKTFWIRRGNYVLVEPIEEGNKVKAEIVRILTKDHVKYFKMDGFWPKEFCQENDEERANEDHSDEDDLLPNPNRVQIYEDGESSESDSDSERTDNSDSEDSVSPNEEIRCQKKL